jgi:glycosyltransferase involved in cell wall biosynthesis
MATENSSCTEQESGIRVRRWEVVHACNLAREVSGVLEAQASVGMNPYLLTFAGPGIHGKGSMSLMQSWQHVRQWRKQFEESDSHIGSNIIHSHSFAAGMAAVRSGVAVVYDVTQWIEDEAAASGNCSAWMARSFRTAEQFVLTRCGAIVVHSQKLKSECVARGIAAEDVYLIPNPIAYTASPSTTDGLLPRDASSVSVLLQVIGSDKTDRGAKATLKLATALAAFAQLSGEIENANLIVLVSDELLGRLQELAKALNIYERVIFAQEADADRAIASADIIIADPASVGDEQLQDSSYSNEIALAAMLAGKAVLACDTSCNRDLSEDGGGLLWYSPGAKSSELARRMAFLARNPDFRRALGDAARQHLLTTRSPRRIGKMYDEVYRHAYFKQHRGNSSHDTSGTLVPMQAGI